MNTKPCPICSITMNDVPQYPDCVCFQCVDKAMTSSDSSSPSSPISFSNVDATGGFISYVNNDKGSIHECVIEGHECYADETRMGGIIVSLIQS